MQQRLLGVASGHACGRERSQKVLWIPRKGARWCVYFCPTHLECYGLPAKPSTRFARGSALLVPEGAKIGAPSGTLPWEPQHLLTQLSSSMSAPDESATARATRSFVHSELGGAKMGDTYAKQRPVCTSWDTYRPFRTPGARPRNYFRTVRHPISAPVLPRRHRLAADTVSA